MELGSQAGKINTISINWALCLTLANDKEDLANEMLTMFIQETPPTKALIEQSFKANDLEALHQHIHKLHGAACYCGVPKLKQLVADTETALKAKQLDQLEQQVKAVLAELTQIEHDYERGDFR